jgi:hypothetical protein
MEPFIDLVFTWGTLVTPEVPKFVCMLIGRLVDCTSLQDLYIICHWCFILFGWWLYFTWCGDLKSQDSTHVILITLLGHRTNSSGLNTGVVTS